MAAMAKELKPPYVLSTPLHLWQPWQSTELKPPVIREQTKQLRHLKKSRRKKMKIKFCSLREQKLRKNFFPVVFSHQFFFIAFFGRFSA
jgi:hypothetical protein